MEAKPVIVVVEVLSVEDPQGLQTYAERAGRLIGARGGVLLGHGGAPVDGEPGFAPLALQYWTSESAFRDWLDSDDYKPLREIRDASAKMRVSVVPSASGLTFCSTHAP